MDVTFVSQFPVHKHPLLGVEFSAGKRFTCGKTGEFTNGKTIFGFLQADWEGWPRDRRDHSDGFLWCGQREQEMKRLCAFVIVTFFALSGLTWGQTEPPTLDDHVSAAINRDDVPAVTRWINSGANLNAQNDSGYTALFMASVSNRLDLMKVLLDKGADPNVRNDQGQTVLHNAVMTGDLDATRLLLEKKLTRK